jgi:hypothetical protein
MRKGDHRAVDGDVSAHPSYAIGAAGNMHHDAADHGHIHRLMAAGEIDEAPDIGHRRLANQLGEIKKGGGSRIVEERCESHAQERLLDVIGVELENSITLNPSIEQSDQGAARGGRPGQPAPLDPADRAEPADADVWEAEDHEPMPTVLPGHMT